MLPIHLEALSRGPPKVELSCPFLMCDDFTVNRYISMVKFSHGHFLVQDTARGCCFVIYIWYNVLTTGLSKVKHLKLNPVLLLCAMIEKVLLYSYIVMMFLRR